MTKKTSLFSSRFFELPARKSSMISKISCIPFFFEISILCGFGGGNSSSWTCGCWWSCVGALLRQKCAGLLRLAWAAPRSLSFFTKKDASAFWKKSANFWKNVEKSCRKKRFWRKKEENDEKRDNFKRKKEKLKRKNRETFENGK